MREYAAADAPFAGIVGQQRNTHCSPFRHDDCVAPIGFPTVIQQVKLPHDMAMHAHDVRRGGIVDEPQRERRATLDAKKRLSGIKVHGDAIE